MTRICCASFPLCKHQRKRFGLPMARKTDPDTSHEAAAIVEPEVGKIQALVLSAFRKHGPMSARRAERLPEFKVYGFSTIRKRISELAKDGTLIECGIDRRGKAPSTKYKLSESKEEW